MENKILVYGVDNDSIDFIAGYNNTEKRTPVFSYVCYIGKELYLLGGFLLDKKTFEELKTKPIIFFAFKQKEEESNKKEGWFYMTSLNLDLIDLESLTSKQRQIFNNLEKSVKSLDW